MKIKLFWTSQQNKNNAILNDIFDSHHFFQETSFPTHFENLASLLKLMDFDASLLENPYEFKRQKESPSLFSIIGYQSNTTIYNDVVEISKNLLKKHDSSLIHYSLARLLITENENEISFIMNFLYEVNPKTSVRGIFELMGIYVDLIIILLESKSLFSEWKKNELKLDMYQDLLESYDGKTNAELILALCRRIEMLSFYFLNDFMPFLIENPVEMVEEILLTTSELFHLVFHKDIPRTFNFQFSLTNIIIQIANLLEPFELGYFSQSLRFELADELTNYLAGLVENYGKNKQDPVNLADILMPFDHALKFNLAIRNSKDFLNDIFANKKTIVEMLVDLTIQSGIWFHPDFFLLKAGKELLSRFDEIIGYLFSYDELDQFRIRETIAMKLFEREFPLSIKLKDTLIMTANQINLPLSLSDTLETILRYSM